MANIGSLQVFLTANTKKFQRSMKRARRDLKRFGRDARRIAIGVGAIGAGATAIAVKTVKAFMEQEDAVNNLRTALKSNGDEVDKLLPKFKNLASTIQSQTVLGDEYVLNMMAQIRNLGVMPDKMEQATKGAIGLSKALGINSQSSARYIALAMQGEYTILQRYVPALRTATTEAEKQKIVMDLMAKGYKQAQAEIETTSGKLKQMANNWGDVLEKIGEFIATSPALTGGMGGLSDKVKELKNLMDSGFMQFFAIEVEIAFKKAWTIVSFFLDNLFRQFIWVETNFGTIWKNGLDIAFAVFKDILNVYKNFWGTLFNIAENGWELIKTIFTGGDVGGAFTKLFDDALNNFVDGIAQTGSELDKALKNSGVTELKFKSFEDLTGELAELDKLRIQNTNKTIAKLQEGIPLVPATGTGTGTGGGTKPISDPQVSNKFAGAITKGSVEAYKASLGAKSTDKKIEKNTDQTVKELQEIGEIIAETQAFNTELTLAVIGV